MSFACFPRLSHLQIQLSLSSRCGSEYRSQIACTGDRSPTRRGSGSSSSSRPRASLASLSRSSRVFVSDFLVIVEPPFSIFGSFKTLLRVLRGRWSTNGKRRGQDPGKLMLSNSRRKRPHDLFTPKRDTPRRSKRQNQRRVRVNFHTRLPLRSKRVPIRTQLHQTTEKQTTLRPVWYTPKQDRESHLTKDENSKQLCRFACTHSPLCAKGT